MRQPPLESDGLFRRLYTGGSRATSRALSLHCEASPAIAQRFTDAIVDHCERFREFPERVICRDDIRPGLHITNYKGRVVIAFAVNSDEVSIIGVFYGGRDYERLLQSELDD
jgi:toxin ParE1/3/4